MAKWKDVNSPQNESWSFEQNKVFEGLLTGKQENVGPNNSKLFTFENSKDHKLYSIWGSAVLNKIWNVPTGSTMRIEYLGKKKGKRGTDFKDYKIQVDEDSQPDMAAQAEAIMSE